MSDLPATVDDPPTAQDRETHIEAAVEAVRTGTSLRAAARQFDIPHTTISHRMRGRKPAAAAHEHQQLLTNAQAEVVVEWCRWKGDMADPMTRVKLRALVFNLSERTPGDVWIRRFLKKHAKEISAKKARGLDPKRAQAFNKLTVEKHFKLLEGLINDNNIPPENIYNEDEKGIQLGGGRKNLPLQYIFSSENRDRYAACSDSLILVTLLEAVAADGAAVPPLFVLPKGMIQVDDLEFEGVGGIATSDQGCTNNDICVEWFRDVFLPFAQGRNQSGAPILLIINGHASHETPELQELCYAANPPVILYCLPPKTTHRLQPLDVGVFGPLQNAWSKHTQECAAQGRTVGRKTVVAEYLQIRDKYMSAKAIKSAFRRTGIWPLKPQIFTEAEFAPSKKTSTHELAPPSYPGHVPSSPSASLTDTDADDSTYRASSPTGDEDFGKDDPADEGERIESMDNASDTEPSNPPPQPADRILIDPVLLEDTERAVKAAVPQGWPVVRRSATPPQSPAPSISPGTPTEPPSPPVSSQTTGGSLRPSAPPTPPLPSSSVRSYGTRSQTHALEEAARSTSTHPSRRSLRISSARTSLLSAQGSGSSELYKELESHRVDLKILSHRTEALTATYQAKDAALRLSEARVRELEARLEASNAHATIRSLENQNLRLQVTEKTGTRKKRKINVDGRVITPLGGVALFAEQDAERKAKEDAENAKKQTKSDTLRAREHQRALATGTKTFPNPLSSYTHKDDLLDIVVALGLDRSGTIAALMERIQAHLATHPDVASNPRFSGLTKARKTRKCTRADTDGPSQDPGGPSASN